MSSVNSERLLEQIRRIASETPVSLPDAELLRRYRDGRDQAAFAALLRRHGAMVFAVCQSVLRQRQDSEDASQAAFLILARQAGSIGRPEALGGWLQRVAFRVALRARAGQLRRRDCEAKAAHSVAAEPSCDDLSWGELRAVLHEELATLPERFRAPLVLCYLEGLTQEEAARQLGWTAASVKGRLQRGRDKLRRRLERRGIALTAAFGAVLTGQAFAETAARSIRQLTTASATTTATALAHGFTSSWIPAKLVLLSVVLLSACLAAGGAVLLAPKPEDAAPSTDKPTDKELTPKATADAHGDPLPEGALTRLGTVRFNHGNGMTNLLFSPDGKKILSRSGGWVCLWDAVTGAELVRRPAEPEVWDRPEMTIRPDGKTLILLHQQSQSAGDIVREWDFAALKETSKRILPLRRQSISVFFSNALSADGRLATVHTDSELRVFDLTTGRELYKLAKDGKDVRAVVFASDRLVTADRGHMIDMWDAKIGKSFRRMNNVAPVGYLAASADGRWLVALEHHYHEGPRVGQWPENDRVHVWDLHAGEKKYELTLGANHWFRSAYFLGDGKRLLTSSLRSPHGFELTVWDMESGKRLREIRDVYGNAIAVSPDGRRLAIGYSMGKFDLWDLETGRRVSNEDGRHLWAATVFFPPTDNRILTLGYHSFSTWAARTGKRLDSIETPRSNDWNTPRRGFSPDGRYAVSFTGDGKEFQAILWDVATRRQRYTLPLPSKENYVYVDAAFSPDSSLLAVWQPLNWHPRVRRVDLEAAIHIWDVHTGKELKHFKDSKSSYPG